MIIKPPDLPYEILYDSFRLLSGQLSETSNELSKMNSFEAKISFERMKSTLDFMISTIKTLEETK